MTSNVTFESLFARYAKPLATVLEATVPGDFNPDSLTPDTFTDDLSTAFGHLTEFNGAVADVSDDLLAAVVYLTDADQTDHPGIRTTLLTMAAKRLESLDFAAAELTRW